MKPTSYGGDLGYVAPGVVLDPPGPPEFAHSERTVIVMLGGRARDRPSEREYAAPCAFEFEFDPNEPVDLFVLGPTRYYEYRY